MARRPADDAATTMGPIANAAQYARVLDMIAAGQADGARLIAGGPGRPAGLDRGFYVQPTIFSGVTRDMRIAREEIFGPVLCIMPYESEDEALAIANDTVYGLGAHVQSTDLVRARAIARHIRSGQVHINYPAWTAHRLWRLQTVGQRPRIWVHGFEEYLETGDPGLSTP
jgi:aldehyde dehydrogenase (NAD+)